MAEQVAITAKVAVPENGESQIRRDLGQLLEKNLNLQEDAPQGER